MVGNVNLHDLAQESGDVNLLQPENQIPVAVIEHSSQFAVTALCQCDEIFCLGQRPHGRFLEQYMTAGIERLLRQRAVMGSRGTDIHNIRPDRVQ
jgi:hypothetical protein